MRTIWLLIQQIVFIPSNLRRGYTLTQQYYIFRIARKWK